MNGKIARRLRKKTKAATGLRAVGTRVKYFMAQKTGVVVVDPKSAKKHYKNLKTKYRQAV